MTLDTAPKKPVQMDWSWSQLKARIEERGWSFRQIALTEGYSHGNVLGEAKRRPYPAAERILAAYAGVEHPKVIWPSRYNADGTTNRPMGRKTMRGQPPVKATTRSAKRNPQKAVSA